MVNLRLQAGETRLVPVAYRRRRGKSEFLVFVDGEYRLLRIEGGIKWGLRVYLPAAQRSEHELIGVENPPRKPQGCIVTLGYDQLGVAPCAELTAPRGWQAQAKEFTSN